MGWVKDCEECGRLAPAEITHNGVCPVGHYICCGWGHDCSPADLIREEDMDHAEYCGPLEALRGRRAMVWHDETYELPLEKRTLRATFVPHHGEADVLHPETGESVAKPTTWPAAHFKLLIPVRW